MGDSSQPIEKKKTIVVTGFGPFGDHEINASWVAVKELAEMGLGRDDCELVIREIPVTYEAVKTEIPNMWQQLSPYLVVHVGVSHLASELTLEQLAHNDGYVKIDADGKMHNCLYCNKGGPLTLKSEMRMDMICDDVNNSQCGVTAVTSTDPGRYLCDFIYYTSLHIDNSRVAFIHVPTLDNPYTAHDLAIGIQRAIHSMLGQLENKCKH